MNESTSPDSADLSLATFEPHVDSVFTITAEETGEKLSLTLVEAIAGSDYRPEELKKGRAPFSVVFTCPERVLPGGVYRLEHEKTGALTMFLSPFESFEKGCKLEGVFN